MREATSVYSRSLPNNRIEFAPFGRRTLVSRAAHVNVGRHKDGITIAADSPHQWTIFRGFALFFSLNCSLRFLPDPEHIRRNLLSQVRTPCV